MGLLWRLSIAIMVFVLSLVYALPSVPYLGTALERVLPSSKINLGLDLKGGIHLTLGVDVAKAQIAIPALEAAHAVDLGRGGVEVDIALVDVLNDAWETIYSMRINAVAGRLGNNGF